MKYAFIQDQLSAVDQARPFSLNTWRRGLDVSRSGFYEWQSRSAKPKPNPDTTALEVAARAAHARGRECYGPPSACARSSLRWALCARLATVKRLRSRLGLRCRPKRRFVRTTDGNHPLPIAPNWLQQSFDQTEAPNQLWVTDITYVPTDEGWLRPAGRKCAPAWQRSKICSTKRSSAGPCAITCVPALFRKRCGWRSSKNAHDPAWFIIATVVASTPAASIAPCSNSSA